MAEFKATRSQQAAIETRGRAVLVSAAAGSGKTKVLTERLLSRISDDADIDSFLIITFTKAAAAELKSRSPFRSRSYHSNCQRKHQCFWYPGYRY